MTDEQPRDRDARPLDPAEKWGQGTDASHPDETGQLDETADQERAATSDAARKPSEELAKGAERAADQPDYGREGS